MRFPVTPGRQSRLAAIATVHDIFVPGSEPNRKVSIQLRLVIRIVPAMPRLMGRNLVPNGCLNADQIILDGSTAGKQYKEQKHPDPWLNGKTNHPDSPTDLLSQCPAMAVPRDPQSESRSQMLNSLSLQNEERPRHNPLTVTECRHPQNYLQDITFLSRRHRFHPP